MRRKLMAICDEAGVTFERAAFSPAITEGRDFTGTILTPDGKLAAYGESDLPSHVGTFEISTRSCLEQIEEINDGDTYIHNDPFWGGTHLIDVRISKPVFFKNQLVAWYCTLGHWSDVGGSVPGGFKIDAIETYEEGLNLPPVKLYSKGTLQKDILKIILNNVRVPQLCYGDLMAEVKAAQTADARLKELCVKYSAETVQAVYGDLFNYSEAFLKDEIEKLPDGIYDSEDFLDYDPGSDTKQPVRFHTRMIKKKSKLVFDLTNSDPAPASAQGAARSSTLSATFTALAAYYPEIPHNHGMFRCVEVITKSGTCVDTPHFHAVSGVAGCAFEKVVSNTTHCITQAHVAKNKGSIEGAVCPSFNIMNLIVTGRDGRYNNRPYIMYLWTEGGYGATWKGDGEHMTMTLYASGSRNQSVEVLETWFPLLFLKVKAPEFDSGIGHGQFRGGAGIDRVFKLRKSGPTKVFVFGDKNRFVPAGFAGGINPIANELIKNPGSANEERLGVCLSNISASEGDMFMLRSQGGPGLGSPLLRSPSSVLEDVKDEWISVKTARDVYGVVIIPRDRSTLQYDIDFQETARIRKELATKLGNTTRGLKPLQMSAYGLDWL